MIEFDQRKLYPTKVIRDNIPMYIDLFTEYYGIDNREHIEKCFNNMFVVGTSRPSTYDIKIHNLKNSIYAELFREFLKDNGIPDSGDEVLKYFGKCTNGSMISSTPIGYYHTYYNELMKSPEQRKREFISESVESLKNIYPSITVDNFEETIKSKDFLDIYNKIEGIYKFRLTYLIDVNHADDLLNDSRLNTVKMFTKYYPDLSISNIDNLVRKGKLLPFKDINLSFTDLESKISQIDSYLEPYVNYYEKNKKAEKEISDRYKRVLALTFKDYFPKDYLSKYIGDDNLILGHIRKPFMDGVFGKKASKTLEDDYSLTYEKNDIKNKRIRYFNMLGINLGSNYEDYLQDERVVKLLNGMKEFLYTKKNLAVIADNDFYNQVGSYTKNKKEYDSLGLVCKNVYNISTLMNGHTYIEGNIKVEDGKVVEYPLVNINFDSPDSGIDERIIHELNHVYELSFTGIDKDKVSFISGWDKGVTYIEDNTTLYEPSKINHDTRGLELLNEIINELIAQDIASIQASTNRTLFAPKEKCIISGQTTYERNRPFVEPFFKEFKADIIESRKHNNVEHIYNVVGKENLEELGKVCSDFYKRFLHGEYKDLRDELNRNADTSRTKFYYDSLNKSKEIFERMKNYGKTM